MVDTSEIIKEHSIMLDPQRESVKIVKNVKSYTWEVKSAGTGKDGTFTDDDYKRLKTREEAVAKDYGEEI